MDIMTILAAVSEPRILLTILLCTLYGAFVGAMPGLTATMAVALLVPFTYFMDPVQAVAAFVATTTTAIFAGDIPGALLRMPGTPASAAYVEDSDAIAKGGTPRTTLFVSLFSSVAGGVIGVLILLANLLMLLTGGPAIAVAAHILRVRRAVQMPLVLMLSLMGAYAITGSTIAIWIVLALGLLGYLMARVQIPLAPAILGIVLGQIVEDNFMVSMMKAQGDLTQFFARDMAAVLGVVTLAVWALLLLRAGRSMIGAGYKIPHKET